MIADLITTSDLSTALAAGARPATTAQAAMLADAVSAASWLAVRVMNGREITRQTYVESYEPTPDSLVFLRQFPVNAVSRVSAGRSPALTIRATGSPARASVAFTLGEFAYSPIVGLTLVSVSAGVASIVPIVFSGLADLAALGAAVSAVSGWSATVPTWALGYPCSDLVGARVAAPALGTGAGLAAYASDIPARLDWRTGILNLPAVELAGAESFASADPSWWPEVGGVASDRVERGRVLVSYDAGFDIVPPDVVAGTVLIAMMLLDRWGANGTLESEKLGPGSYTQFSPELMAAVPKAARDFLVPYRIGRV